jgi:hypothetical protein
MNLRLLTTPLLATGLLLSTLGCSKKDDPVALNTGSYKLDGNTFTCQAKALASTSSDGRLSYLKIELATLPEPATGPETLRLYFAKANTQSSNTYTLTDISLISKGNTSLYFFSADAAALTTTSSGGFSGQLITSISPTPALYTTVTNGTFSNVHP